MRNLSAFLLAGILSAAPARAGVGSGTHDLGVGLGLGSPSSVNVKYFFEHDVALDLGLVLGRPGGGLGMHTDALWHAAKLTTKSGVEVPFYLGLGIELGLWRDRWYWDSRGRRWAYVYGEASTDLALRVPFGVALWSPGGSFEAYVEIGPEVWMLGTYASLFGALGARFYF